MEPVNPELVPRKGLKKEEMKNLQRNIAEKAVFQDRFKFSAERPEELTVAGVDQAFTDDKSVSAAVVMEDGEVIEEASAAAELDIPYIPGLLAFREGESIVKALGNLDAEPDILFLDGSGRIHFREAGIATHIGVIFDEPSIGIAKNLLCGETSWNGGKLEQGRKIPVTASEKVENTENGEIIGYTFQSKQYTGDRKINPLYVSPGHRISAGSSVKIVEEFCQNYKLPEPTRLADKRVSELKDEYR
ncbi:endonuclease V [Candidatus Nanosalina sp. VS9-1]|uniref:endonuclease V n=1 Tax=Candidatus Nanosalina sp. VS9-1 TaxID=3388566 RepID=UPI0039DFBF44